jgi:hypothetical protein
VAAPDIGRSRFAGGGYAMKTGNPRARKATPAVEKASVYIEQEEANKFKIESEQLEQIGAQLRGPPKPFSIFYTIILPLIVSAGTVILSSLFQYISWYNSVNLQSATEVATSAERAYQNAAAAIGTRQYATLAFLPALEDLVIEKTEYEANANPSVEGNPAPAGQKLGSDEARRAFAIASPLHKFDLDIKQQRFVSYFEHVKSWNENYDHLLTDIDYALDRPVFKEAGKQEGVVVSDKEMSQINCSKSLADEFERLHLDSDSLKLRLGAIHYCFIAANEILRRQLKAAISTSTLHVNDSDDETIAKYIDSLRMKALAFRCNALHRIDYYKDQKELSILSVSSLWRWRSDVRKQGAKKHLDDTANICNGQTRIARATLTN